MTETLSKQTKPKSAPYVPDWARATESCGGCKFYIDGFCQRFPPSLFRNGEGVIQGHWPAVGVQDWCGEFKKK